MSAKVAAIAFTPSVCPLTANSRISKYTAAFTTIRVLTVRVNGGNASETAFGILFLFPAAFRRGHNRQAAVSFGVNRPDRKDHVIFGLIQVFFGFSSSRDILRRKFRVCSLAP